MEAENQAQETEHTPVQQDEDRTVGHVPLQHGSNDQRATSPALPAPEHPAEDRLARGSAPDGEAVWDLAALRTENGDLAALRRTENGDLAALRRTGTWQPLGGRRTGTWQP